MKDCLGRLSVFSHGGFVWGKTILVRESNYLILFLIDDEYQKSLDMQLG